MLPSAVAFPVRCALWVLAWCAALALVPLGSARAQPLVVVDTSTFSEPAIAPGLLRTRWLILERETREHESLDDPARQEALVALLRTLEESGTPQWRAAADVLATRAQRRCADQDLAACERLARDALLLAPGDANAEQILRTRRAAAAPRDFRTRARDVQDTLRALRSDEIAAARTRWSLRCAVQTAGSATLWILAGLFLLRHRARVGVDLWIATRGILSLALVATALLTIAALGLWIAPERVAPLVCIALLPWMAVRERILTGAVIALGSLVVDAAPADPTRAAEEQLFVHAAQPEDLPCELTAYVTRAASDEATLLADAWRTWRTSPNHPTLDAFTESATTAEHWYAASAWTLRGHLAWRDGDPEGAARLYHRALQHEEHPANRLLLLRLLHAAALALDDREGAHTYALRLRDLAGPIAEDWTSYRGSSRHRVLLPVLPLPTPRPVAALLPTLRPPTTIDPLLPSAFALVLAFSLLIRRRVSTRCSACGFPSSPVVRADAFEAGLCIACHGARHAPARLEYDARTRIERAVWRHDLLHGPALRTLGWTLPPLAALLRGRAIVGATTLFFACLGAVMILHPGVGDGVVPLVPHSPAGLSPRAAIGALMITAGWFVALLPAHLTTRETTRAADDRSSQRTEARR